jgi:hypothetical protein
MTNTNSPGSDDVFGAGIQAMPLQERIDALLDVVTDTATWQPATNSAADGRAR